MLFKKGGVGGGTNISRRREATEKWPDGKDKKWQNYPTSK
jgi:hypothetical protein